MNKKMLASEILKVAKVLTAKNSYVKWENKAGEFVSEILDEQDSDVVADELTERLNFETDLKGIKVKEEKVSDGKYQIRVKYPKEKKKEVYEELKECSLPDWYFEADEEYMDELAKAVVKTKKSKNGWTIKGIDDQGYLLWQNSNGKYLINATPIVLNTNVPFLQVEALTKVLNMVVEVYEVKMEIIGDLKVDVETYFETLDKEWNKLITGIIKYDEEHKPKVWSAVISIEGQASHIETFDSEEKANAALSQMKNLVNFNIIEGTQMWNKTLGTIEED